MYQRRIRYPLSPALPEPPEADIEAIWKLFVAIGQRWQLEDQPEQYRSRLLAFLRNRIAMNPLYLQLYAATAKRIAHPIGDADPCQALLDTLIAPQLGPPETEAEFIRQYVINELIALRVTLGGFASFGAVNFCGFMGGENIEGRPAPYRTMEPGA